MSIDINPSLPPPIDDEELIFESTDKLDDNTSIIIKDDNLFNLLENRWTFWYTHRPTTFRNSAIDYDSCLKKLGILFLNYFNLYFEYI